jgi:hypothetical protein
MMTEHRIVTNAAGKFKLQRWSDHDKKWYSWWGATIFNTLEEAESDKANRDGEQGPWEPIENSNAK